MAKTLRQERAAMAVSDIEYDLITALQSKLEGLEVYDIYIEDCEEGQESDLARMFEEIRADDERHATRLREALVRVLGSSS
jgi:rubrerythrin